MIEPIEYELQLPNTLTGQKLAKTIGRILKHTYQARRLRIEQSKEMTARACFYCGASPEQIKRTKYESYLANGLDRIDSNQGYSESNCVPCCWPCNQMKLDQGLDEFLARVCSIATLHGGALFQRKA